MQAHRLVAEAFIPNPNNLPIVKHKDDNPLNNNVSNLEWGIQSDNILDSYYRGNHNTVKPVIMMDIDNNILAYFNSISEASRNTKIASSSIHKALNNIYKTAGGYNWKYKHLNN